MKREICLSWYEDLTCSVAVLYNIIIIQVWNILHFLLLYSIHEKKIIKIYIKPEAVLATVLCAVECCSGKVRLSVTLLETLLTLL